VWPSPGLFRDVNAQLGILVRIVTLDGEDDVEIGRTPLQESLRILW
jgi:hypothetical protein